MERDPMQWTNLAASTDSEILSQKARLAASFPASFAPDVANDKKDKGDKKDINRDLDPTIKPQRAAANLR